MTTAETIKTQIEGASAVTLYGGYAQFSGDRRVTFEPAKMTHVHRKNKDGRTTHLIVRYEDNSVLEFTWSEARGACYVAHQP